jgi:acyl-CoA synthetase (AMP-forming)/AMP-acid ligase II
MQGYFRDAEKTKEAVLEQDGIRWMKTGGRCRSGSAACALLTRCATQTWPAWMKKVRSCPLSHGSEWLTLEAPGYVQIRGRVKDLVIRGGENVSLSHLRARFSALTMPLGQLFPPMIEKCVS